MKKNLKTYESIQKIQSILEKRGKFNYDYGRPCGRWAMPDKNFEYQHTFPETIIDYAIRSVLQLLAPIVIKVAYGAKVKGKRNLKKIGKSGAICICNHFSFFDVLFVRQATGHYRSYTTVAPINNKLGVSGFFIKHAGVLPFSSNLVAAKKLNNEMERLLDNGKIINFYPEEALWHAYEKPRTMNVRAFHYAVKFDVPVVPIFCTFERTKKGHIKKLVINVCKPIYPDKTLPKKKQAETMLSIAQTQWQNCYDLRKQPKKHTLAIK